MDVTRRAWITGATAGAVVLQGPPTLGGLRLGEQDDDALTRLFDQLDERVALFREATSLPRLRAWLEERGLSGDTFHDLFAGLLTSSLARDLPERSQRRAVVQRRLRSRLVGTGRAALGLRDLFRATPPDQRREVGRRLGENPELVERLKQAMEPWFGPDLVEPERKAQLDQALDSVVWDLVHGDPEQVFEEQARKVDRFARMADHLLARQLASPGEATEGGVAPAEDTAPGSVAGMTPCEINVELLKIADGQRMHSQRAYRKELRQKTKALCEAEAPGSDNPYRRYLKVKREEASRRTLIIGAALTGLGVVTIPVYIGICILTPAVILLIVSLLLFIASALA